MKVVTFQILMEGKYLPKRKLSEEGWATLLRDSSGRNLAFSRTLFTPQNNNVLHIKLRSVNADLHIINICAEIEYFCSP